jgi:hypothetical protein
MRVWPSLILPMMAFPALACSCASSEVVKACQIYQSTPVIFRGRVIDHNDNTQGMISGPILYRFRVIESFKGIPKDVHDVFIDPASGTSCQTQFSLDQDYLIYAGGSQPAPTAVTVFPRSAAAHPIPTAWKGLENSVVYSVGGCSPTRSVRDDDDDLIYLRSAGNIRPQDDGWLEGRSVQNFSMFSQFADFVAAPNAILTFTSRSGERAVATSNSSGAYRLGPIHPGVYAFSANNPLLGEAGIPDTQVAVPPGGCSVVNVSFDSRSSIEGRVVDATGKPAPNIRVELGELLPSGKVRNVPHTWANTDKNGAFTIQRAPVGRIVLAANLNGAPTEQMPFDPYYAPGTHRLEAARLFFVKPGEDVTGVFLLLPKPLPFGDLYVDVMWPDGTPAVDGARAFASTNNANADFERAPSASNRVKLRVALNRKYRVHVDWLDFKPREYFRFVEGGEPKTLDFTRNGQTIELRLKTPRPR